MKPHSASAEIRAQAVAEYMEGIELRKQAQQLSNDSLAAKFERSTRTIIKVVNGLPTSVPDEEVRLIRDCASERDRLKSRAAELTRVELGKKYGVCGTTIGYWADNPVRDEEAA